MSERYALIIGNSDYKDKRLPQLAAPRVDARGLAEALRAKAIGGFADVTTLVDRLEKTVRLAIAQFCNERHPEDTVLLYFSGHGVKDSHGQLYFAVKDTNRDLLSATAIPASFVTEQLNSCESRAQILLLDCCYSGAFVRAKGSVGGSVGTEANFQVPGYGRVTLTASDATEYAWEGDQGLGEVKPSIFTRYVIAGLKTGDADLKGRGQISTDDLYQYANQQVLRSGSKQKPMRFADEQQGEIFIAANPKPVPKQADALPQKPVLINLAGRNGRRFAGTSFRVDNTSQAYYRSPYFLENRGRLQPIPPPRVDPPRMRLADVLEKSGIAAIQAAKRITFHAVGDTGAARETGPQTIGSVAKMMVADVRAGTVRAPAFFFHLGDIIFLFAESKYYYDQFYGPFQDYDRPIFAIPGNHDGMVYDPAVPTLSSFLRNFCAPRPTRAADAREHTRSVMTQPGVYFSLDAPFVSIIGLYSNVWLGPEGSISSKDHTSPIGESQLRFLEAELERLRPVRETGERAVILAVHHPPISAPRVHKEPGRLSLDVDRACRKAGLWPDAILSSHYHSYQRLTRRVGKRRIPYIICGTGGYGLSQLPGASLKTPYTVGDFTVETVAVEFGYLTVTVEIAPAAKRLIIAFHTPRLGHNVDQVTIDLLSDRAGITTQL